MGSRDARAWLEVTGSIQGLRRWESYDPMRDTEHDLAIRRLVHELDGETWLQEQGVARISVIVEFTRDGKDHAGRPTRTPAVVAHSRIDAGGALAVSSRVPEELVSELAGDERERFWHDWYSEMVTTVARRRRWGMPRRRADAEALRRSLADHDGDGDGDGDRDGTKEPPRVVVQVDLPWSLSDDPDNWELMPTALACLLADDSVELRSMDGNDTQTSVWLSGPSLEILLEAASAASTVPGMPAGATVLVREGPELVRHPLPRP